MVNNNSIHIIFYSSGDSDLKRKTGIILLFAFVQIALVGKIK